MASTKRKKDMPEHEKNGPEEQKRIGLENAQLHEELMELRAKQKEELKLLKLAKKANKQFHEKFLKQSEELEQAKKARSDQLRQERAAFSDLFEQKRQVEKALKKMNRKFADEKFSYRQAENVLDKVIGTTNLWLHEMSITDDGTSNWWRYEFRGEIKTHFEDCSYILRLVRHESHVLSDEQKQKMLPTSLSFSDTRPAEIVVVTCKIQMSLHDVHIAKIDVYDISRLGIFRQMAEAIKQDEDNPLNSSAMEGKKFARLITHVSFMLGFKFLEFIRKHYWELEQPHDLHEFDQKANISIHAAAAGTKHILKPYDEECGMGSHFGYREYPVFDTESYRLTEHFIQTLIDKWKTATKTYEEMKKVKENPSAKSRFNARF